MPTPVDLQAWDYTLPDECIARYPASRRDRSRLLHLPLPDGPTTHGLFDRLPELLRAGDLLVVNDTRVMQARLEARRHTGGRVEILVTAFSGHHAEALARPAKKLKLGQTLTLRSGIEATVEREAVDGLVELRFSEPVADIMASSGELPIPPYLQRPEERADRERYQTIFAGPLGAAAAPTAGLHFTDELLRRLGTSGVRVERLTLHVGLGTFRPLRPEDVDRRKLHAEWYTIPEACAEAVATTRADGGRVIAVGTTSVRALESATPTGSRLPRPGAASTTLFLRPPDRLRAVDGLITNFHLPKSSLLMLVACLCGRERLMATYAEAVTRGYRFYSYGDAMLLL